MAIVQALTGDDPGDNGPIDTEAIGAVVSEYEEKARLFERLNVSRGRSDQGRAPSHSATAPLREAVERALREIGVPGREIHWKVFCAQIWTRCGVAPTAKGFSERT